MRSSFTQENDDIVASLTSINDGHWRLRLITLFCASYSDMDSSRGVFTQYEIFFPVPDHWRHIWYHIWRQWSWHRPLGDYGSDCADDKNDDILTGRRVISTMAPGHHWDWYFQIFFFYLSRLLFFVKMGTISLIDERHYVFIHRNDMIQYSGLHYYIIIVIYWTRIQNIFGMFQRRLFHQIFYIPGEEIIFVFSVRARERRLARIPRRKVRRAIRWLEMRPPTIIIGLQDI